MNQQMITHPLPFGAHITIKPDAHRHTVRDMHVFSSDRVFLGGWRYRIVTFSGQRANVYDDEIENLIGIDENATLERLAL